MTGLSKTKNTKRLVKIQYSRVLIARFSSKFKFVTERRMFAKRKFDRKMSDFSIKKKKKITKLKYCTDKYATFMLQITGENFVTIY